MTLMSTWKYNLKNKSKNKSTNRNLFFRCRHYTSKKDRVSGLTTAATLWLSAAIGLAVGIGFYEGAVIATIICLVTLVSLKGVSDFINDMTTKSYIMVFDTDNFDEEGFLEFASKEGVEVRKLDIMDEDIDDKSMINSTLSFNRNYNIGKFFKELKSGYHLNSVKLNKEKDKDWPW